MNLIAKVGQSANRARLDVWEIKHQVPGSFRGTLYFESRGNSTKGLHVLRHKAFKTQDYSDRKITLKFWKLTDLSDSPTAKSLYNCPCYTQTVRTMGFCFLPIVMKKIQWKTSSTGECTSVVGMGILALLIGGQIDSDFLKAHFILWTKNLKMYLFFPFFERERES